MAPTLALEKKKKNRNNNKEVAGLQMVVPFPTQQGYLVGGGSFLGQRKARPKRSGKTRV